MSASGRIQFYDRFLPGLGAGDYQVSVQQSVAGLDTGGYFTPHRQSFTVTGPRFGLAPGDLGEVFPPADSNGDYAALLPSVVLNRRTLPWERAVADDRDLPWLALLTFQADEVVPDPGTGLPLRTSSVADFLGLAAADPTVLVPAIGPSAVAPDVLAGTMTSVQVPLSVFTAVAPSLPEAALLAHARQTDTADQAESDPASDGWYAIVLGNRFPNSAVSADGSGSRNLSCLVSLEGLGAWLPGGSGLAATGGPRADVRLAVLASWSFVCNPAAGESFAGLVGGLVAQQGAEPSTLLPRIPVPPDSPAAGSAAADRLRQGCAPLGYHLPTGEDTFAWYRGPCSAVVPQPLPPPADGAAHAANSAELTVYLADHGVFDLSYAAAFEAGRLAALADRGFAVALVNGRRAAYRTLHTVRSRLAGRRFGKAGVDELPAPRLHWRHFGARLQEGMADELSAALTSTEYGPAAAVEPAAPVAAPAPAPAHDPVAATRGLLARDDIRELLAAHVAGEAMDPVTDWLARLSLLHQVPFRHLVPDERMLPVESVRFFHLDPGWIAALTDGALSIGVEGSRDLELQQAWSAPLLRTVAEKAGRVRAQQRGRPDLAVRTAAPAADGTPPARSGMLLRSAVVAGWPGLVVRADGGAVPLVRLDRLAESVLLAVFDGVPGTVTLGEPWHGLRFGLQDGNVLHLRSPGGAPLGGQFPPAGGGDLLARYLRAAPSGAGARVLAVAALAHDVFGALGAAAQGASQGAALLATQLVRAPQQLTFQQLTSQQVTSAQTPGSEGRR
jgi:hypothetical protein